MDTNPFSTRFVRPGSLAYLYPRGHGRSTLVERLAAAGWRGQIVGPHGTGKSTLLRDLAPALRDAGRDVRLYMLHPGVRRLPATPSERRAWNRSTLVVVDGYEQMPAWRRWLLNREVRRRGAGLLVTTHRDLGLPTLLTTGGDLAVVGRLVETLLEGTPGAEAARISQADVEAAYIDQRGDVRETLFALYDLYEKRRDGRVSPAGEVGC